MCVSKRFPVQRRFQQQILVSFVRNVSRRSVRAWDPRHHQRDNPKVNVLSDLSADEVYGRFFAEQGRCRHCVTWRVGTCHLKKGVVLVFFRQDGGAAWQHLSNCSPAWWIGRGGPTVLPARSPDINARSYIFWDWRLNRTTNKKNFREFLFMM
jgi:hypothetical protein